MAPGRVQLERALAGRQPFHIIRQQDGQLFFRHRYGAAVRAVDDRDGGSPITLARNQPVMKAIIDGAPADLVLFYICNCSVKTFFGRCASQGTGIDHAAMRFHGGRHRLRVQRFTALRLNNHPDGQIEFTGEFEIALVMCRYSHDGARSIGHQNVIGNPNRDAVARGWVNSIAATENTCFFAVGRFALDVGLATGLLFIVLHLIPLGRRRNLIHQWVFG